MNKFFTLLRKPARMIAMISAGAYAFFSMLAAFGSLGGAEFGEVLGTLLFVIMLTGLVGGYIFACIKRKDEICRFIGFLLLAYMAGRNVMSLPNGAYNSGSDAFNAYLVFSFLAAICASGVLALVLLKMFIEKLKQNKILFIVEVCLVGSFALFDLISVFCLIGHEAGWGAGWASYMSDIAHILFLPAILIAFVLLFVPEGQTPLDTEVAKEEPVVEEKPEEVVVEEKEEAAPEEKKEEKHKVDLQKGE